MEDKIYKLEINKDEIYVPLWNPHIEFDHLDSTILVKNIPELPDNIKIDKFNNIHISLVIKIQELLEKGHKVITLYGKKEVLQYMVIIYK